nr:MAG TPA: hypothetical protein [Caudoviricetes sp.]
MPFELLILEYQHNTCFPHLQQLSFYVSYYITPHPPCQYFLRKFFPVFLKKSCVLRKK